MVGFDGIAARRLLPVLIALLLGPACASYPPLAPGQRPTLAEGEGVLVIHTDSQVPLAALEVWPDRGTWSAGAPDDVQLVVLPAGSYRWRRFLSGLDLPVDPRLSFRVVPGAISYPGSILARQLPAGLGVRTLNRSALVLPLIRAKFPALGDLPIVHTGRVRDDFFEHYERARLAATDDPDATPARASRSRPARFAAVPAEPFFRRSELREVALSPHGTWLARLLERGSQGTVTVRNRSGIEREVMRTERPIREVTWADDQTLLALYALGTPGPVVTRVIELRVRQGRIQTRERELETRGHVVHPLPEAPGTILFHSVSAPGSVLRIELNAGGSETPVASLPWSVDHWLTDPSGVVRAAVVITPTRFVIWYRDSAAASWRPIHSAALDALELDPIGFDSQGRLLVKSDRGRDRYALFELDPGTGELGALVYEHPTAQITDLRIDRNTGVLAVGVFENGQARYEYLGETQAEDLDAVARFFPGQNVSVATASLDRSVYVLSVNSPGSPGQFFRFEASSETAEPVGSTAPWLDPLDLARVRTFRSRSADGVEVESFLTLPPARRPSPLVVMPHGGPIGVRETRRFDAEAQFLAASGFAVLKVNFRGSSGYGKAHFEAGKLQWGAGIEDDIDAAIRDVLASGLVDPERVCIAGGSYGGYSALMSAIRWPDRFRCVATFGGATDLPLMFNSSDFAWDEEVRLAFTGIVGDPEADYEALRAKSPVYRAAELSAPVFIAHGASDERVDVEHAYRLDRVLALWGHPTELWILPGVGHGFADQAQLVAYYERLRDFLARHLLPP